MERAAKPVPFHTSFCLGPAPGLHSPPIALRLISATSPPPHTLPDFAIPVTTQLLLIPRSRLTRPPLSHMSSGQDNVASPCKIPPRPALGSWIAWRGKTRGRKTGKGVSSGISFSTLVYWPLTSVPKPRFWGCKESPSNPRDYCSVVVNQGAGRLAPASKVTGRVRVESARE